MDSFRQYLNENIFSGIWARLVNWLNSWWVRIKSVVLSSVKVDEQERSVVFTFPGDQTVAESSSFNKGLRIMQNIDTSDWKPAQEKVFINQIEKNIRNIASVLGLQLEVDVVLHLSGQYKMQIVGASLQQLQTQRQEFSAKVQNYLRNEFVYQQFDAYVRKHASELADAIYRRTQELIRCTPTKVLYRLNVPGQKADLKMLCNESSSTAWSLKYVSEGLVSVRTLSMAQAYQILGGKDKSRDAGYYDFLAKTSDAAEFKEQAFDDLWNAIQESDWTSDPRNFTKLLTLLLRGDDKSLMAIKNYAVNKSAVGAPSTVMAKNFKTQTRPDGIIFSPLPGATVTANRAKEYIKLSYVVGDSKSPTYINVEPNTKSEGGVRAQFRVNNLAG